MRDLYKKLAAIQSAANWFYILGAMSLASTFLKKFFEKDFSHLLGLGFENLIDHFITELGNEKLAALAITAHVLLAFFLFFIAKQAKDREKWAFATGLVFLSADTIIFTFFSGSLISLGFRIIIIAIIFSRGFLNLNEANNLAKEMQARLSKQWENEGLEVEMEELN